MNEKLNFVSETAKDMADNLASDLREKELCLNFKFRVFEYGI